AAGEAREDLAQLVAGGFPETVGRQDHADQKQADTTENLRDHGGSILSATPAIRAALLRGFRCAGDSLARHEPGLVPAFFVPALVVGHDVQAGDEAGELAVVEQ